MSIQALLALLALVFLVFLTACGEVDTAALSVPRGKPVAIDGTLAPGEWDDAYVQAMSDGSELLLKADGGHLYLGIRSNTPEMIVGNVFVHQDDQIKILHTSAALGTAIYEREAETWTQTQAFDWRCRRTDASDAAQAERETFLQDEGWTSINSRLGTPNELEYQIKLAGSPIRLAANLLRSSDPDVKVIWPVGLDDDTIRPTPGGLPAQMSFSPDRWRAVSLP